MAVYKPGELMGTSADEMLWKLRAGIDDPADGLDASGAVRSSDAATPGPAGPSLRFVDAYSGPRSTDASDPEDEKRAEHLDGLHARAELGRYAVPSGNSASGGSGSTGSSGSAGSSG